VERDRSVRQSQIRAGKLTIVAAALLLVVLHAGCSRLVTSPSPAGVHTVLVLPVDNRTGSPLDAEAPSLGDLIGRAPQRPPVTAADLLTTALRLALAERGFAARLETPPPGAEPIASPEAAGRFVAQAAPDAVALYTRLRVWETTSRSHLLYVDVALDAWLVTATGATVWTAHLPATPIDGGGASTVSLGYPEVARRVAELVTNDLQPAAPEP
jgi:hypothetical protein